MPLPTIEYHGEDVTITRFCYGTESNTATMVACEWGDGKGEDLPRLGDLAPIGQWFGVKNLDERTAFVRDLCAFFGVEARPGEEHAALAALSGLRARALWYRRGGAMEGFERDGRRFLLWEWRRRMFPDAGALDPRADRIAVLRREIASRERRLRELRDELTRAVDAAHDWPVAKKAADDLLNAGNEWWNGPIDGDDRWEIFEAICLAHSAVHWKDDLEARDQAEKLSGLTSGIEPLRGPLERLCAELGV